MVQQLRDQTAASEWRRASSGSGLRVLPPIVPAGFCITPEWPLSKQAWFIKQPPPSSRASEPVHVHKKRVNASVRPAGLLSRATGRNFNELVGLFLIGIKEWNCSDCKSVSPRFRLSNSFNLLHYLMTHSWAENVCFIVYSVVFFFLHIHKGLQCRQAVTTQCGHSCVLTLFPLLLPHVFSPAHICSRRWCNSLFTPKFTGNIFWRWTQRCSR